MSKIQSIHPELTEKDLFVEGKQLNDKGFTLLMAHFYSSLTKTNKPTLLPNDLNKTNKMKLLEAYLQKLNYVSMFYILKSCVFLTGPISEVAKLTNQSVEDFISKLHMFDWFNICLIDDILLGPSEVNKKLYIVPTEDKPYIFYTPGMAKRKARKHNSYVITTETNQCELLEKNELDRKFTNIGSVLRDIIWNEIHDDSPNGLYCSFRIGSASLSIKEQIKMVETIFDEVTAATKPTNKITLYFRPRDYLKDDFDYLIYYNKNGKKIANCRGL